MLIRGGHLIDPAAGRDGIFDVLVKNGVVAELAEWSNGEEPVWQETADEIMNLYGIGLVYPFHINHALKSSISEYYYNEDYSN